MKVKIYVEGGGNTRLEQAAARKAFAILLKKLFPARSPAIVASGGRDRAFSDFKKALKIGDGWPMLLVDSEGPVAEPGKAWEHLKARDGWERPAEATDDQAQLMVQSMETWLLADTSSMQSWYGSGFKATSIPSWPALEQVPKVDVYAALEKATAPTKTKGPYSKGAHSWQLLERVDPERLRASLPHAARLFETIKARTQ